MVKANLVLGASVLLFSSVSHGTIIYDDGFLHTVDVVVLDNIVLSNRTELAIVQNGQLISTDTDAITCSVNCSDISMSGNATVNGNIRADQSEFSMRDDASVVGSVEGVQRIIMRDSATIVGGVANTSDGALHASISGGQITGRNGGSALIGDSGSEEIVLDIRGGVLQGGRGGNGIGNGGESLSGNIYGGSILGGGGTVSGGHGIDSGRFGLNLNILGGNVRGGDGSDFGGDALRLAAADGTGVGISAGEFNAGSGSVDDGWLMHLLGDNTRAEISGGLFGYENIGRGIGLFANSTLDIYGWNLQIEDNWLTGYLGDGNWIQTYVSFSSDSYTSSGNLNLHQVATNPVPEPPEILLFATGILGLLFAHRRRRQGTSSAAC